MMMNVMISTLNPGVVKILSQRVKRGVKVIKKKFGPMWYKKIDVHLLDLADHDMCVAGQLFADGYHFSDLDKLGKDVGANPVKYGFDVWANDDTETQDDINVPDEATLFKVYGILGDLWVNEIRQAKRRKRN